MNEQIGSPALATEPASSAGPPVLPAGVRLIGEMPDVGFRERQWLVERDGHYLQVTELLYRVLERIDGARSTDDIAREVTEHSPWALERSQVDYLIDSKLRPLRLVADGGTEAQDPAALQADSPLRLAMRMRALPAWLVNPAADALRHLYSPLALLVIGFTIAAAHWWLYTTHRVTEGLQAAFYAPGGLLFVLALAIVAGLFHELGHAAALRYGGGRSRGIGFGLYLMFPAFYSDVTDSYRLPRAARVRTDLGGIYFHMIFATALIGLAIFFETQFLIAAVLVFNIEAFRQLLPIVRLDGYWLLADLTGIPDFFSQMKAFAARAAPRHVRGDALPAFRPWVQAVFALYILATIPVLIWLLALTVLYVPDLATLTRQAVIRHAQIVSAADSMGMRVLATTQLMLVPLPLLATTYFLYRLLRAGLGYLVPNGFPLLAARFAGATAAAAAAAVGIVLVTGADAVIPQTASAQTRGIDLLRTAERALTSARVFEADFSGVVNGEPFGGRMTLRRPNHARVDVSGSESVGAFTVVSDGSTLYVHFPGPNRFTEAVTAPDGRNIDAFIIDPVRLFFRPHALLPAAGETATYQGRQHIDGVELAVVEVTSPGPPQGAVSYYISPQDGLVRRVIATTHRNGKSSARRLELRDIRVDGSVDDRRFAWAPPSGASPLTLATLGVRLP